MSVPTGDLLCRLVEGVTGSAPHAVEFVADADPRRGWLLRAWHGERSWRDYRLCLTNVVPGVAVEALHEWLIEEAFERWPPADIRGALRRCRCSARI